jgi:hypothetical protein
MLAFNFLVLGLYGGAIITIKLENFQDHLGDVSENIRFLVKNKDTFVDHRIYNFYDSHLLNIL